jgi:ElaB/YqjD/DUF883 family membrane-anchored ribosome-binding protein
MQEHMHDREQFGAAGSGGALSADTSDMKSRASNALDGAASTLERAGHTLSDRVATAADKAASALGTTAEYVRDIDSRDIMQDLSSMAKRHPGATLAAAVALGFFVGRSATRS